MVINYVPQTIEISKVLKQDGQVRGGVLLSDSTYVRKHYGHQALGSVEAMTTALGYYIDYDRINTMAWYPASIRVISLLAIAMALGLSDKELREMGWAAPRNSILTKLMMRYFASLRMLVESLPSYWRKNYTVGSLTGKLADRALYLRLAGIEIPRQLFSYLEGYFTSVVSMVIGNDRKVLMTDIGRTDGDDTCYELLISWENKSEE
jgi:hypothetical protein